MMSSVRQVPSRRRAARRRSPPPSGPRSCRDWPVLRASRSARSISSIARRPPPSGRRRRRAPSRARRDTSAASAGPAAPGDVRVGAAASRVRNVSTTASSQASPARARLLERGRAGPERHLERRRVLARDAVPIGGEPHHVEQRHRRLVGDVLRVRLSQPARRRAAESPRTPRARRPRSSRRAPRRTAPRRPRKGRPFAVSETLPGIGDDPSFPAPRAPAAPAAGRCRDSCSSASSAPWLRRPAARLRRAARAGAGKRLADRRRAGEEVLVARCRRSGGPATRCPASARSLRAGTRAARRRRRQRRSRRPRGHRPCRRSSSRR